MLELASTKTYNVSLLCDTTSSRCSVAQMEQLGDDLEVAQRSAQVAKHGPPASGGELQRRIAELETALAQRSDEVQQLTVREAVSIGLTSGGMFWIKVLAGGGGEGGGNPSLAC